MELKVRDFLERVRIDEEKFGLNSELQSFQWLLKWFP